MARELSHGFEMYGIHFFAVTRGSGEIDHKSSFSLQRPRMAIKISWCWQKSLGEVLTLFCCSRINAWSYSTVMPDIIYLQRATRVNLIHRKRFISV